MKLRRSKNILNQSILINSKPELFFEAMIKREQNQTGTLKINKFSRSDTIEENDDEDWKINELRKQTRNTSCRKVISKYLNNLQDFKNKIQSRFPSIPDFFDALSQSMLYEKIQADKIIFRINDTADKFYIVLRGSVDVLKSYPLRCNLTIVEYVSYLMKLKLYDENHLLCSTLNNVNNQSLVKLKEMDFIHIQGLYTYAYKIIETIVVEYKCKSFDHLESIFHQFIGFSNRKTTMKLSKLSMSKISLNDLEMRFLNILGTYSTNNLMDASSQLLRNKSRSKSNKHIIRSICTGSDSNILNSLAHSNQDKLDKRRSQHRALIDLNLLSETIKYCLCNEIKNTNYLTKIGVNFDVDIRSRLSSYWEANSDYTGKSNQKFSFNVNEYYKYSTLQTGNYFGDLALESDSSKRNVTILTTEDCHFGILNKLNYNETVKETNLSFKRSNMNYLMKYPFFETYYLTAFERKVFNLVKFHSFSRNEKIITQGEKSENVFFYKTGIFELQLRANFKEINDLIEYFGGHVQPGREKYLLGNSKHFREKYLQRQNYKIKVLSNIKFFSGLGESVFNGNSLFDIECKSKNSEVFSIESKYFNHGELFEYNVLKRADLEVSKVKKIYLERILQIRDIKLDLLLCKFLSARPNYNGCHVASQQRALGYSDSENYNQGFVIQERERELFKYDIALRASPSVILDRKSSDSLIRSNIKIIANYIRNEKSKGKFRTQSDMPKINILENPNHSGSLSILESNLNRVEELDRSSFKLPLGQKFKASTNQSENSLYFQNINNSFSSFEEKKFKNLRNEILPTKLNETPPLKLKNQKTIKLLKMKTLTHDVSVGKSQGKENVINIRRRIFFNHDINSIEEEQVKETPKNKHKTRKLINLRIFNQMTQNAKNFRSKEKEKTKAESKISIEKYIKQSMINYKNLVNKTFESTLNTYLKGFDSMQTIPNSTRSNQTNPSSIFKSHTKSDNLKIRDIQNLNYNISSKGKSLLGKMTAVYNDCKEAKENKVRIIDSLCIDSFCNSKLSSNLMNSSNLITSGNTNSHKTRLIVENKSLFDSLGCRNQDPLLSNAYGYKCKYMNSNTLKSNRAIVNPIKARNAKQPNFMLFHKVRKEYLLEKENKKNLKARQKRALKIKGAESENH